MNAQATTDLKMMSNARQTVRKWWEFHPQKVEQVPYRFWKSKAMVGDWKSSTKHNFKGESEQSRPSFMLKSLILIALPYYLIHLIDRVWSREKTVLSNVASVLLPTGASLLYLIDKVARHR